MHPPGSPKTTSTDSISRDLISACAPVRFMAVASRCGDRRTGWGTRPKANDLPAGRSSRAPDVRRALADEYECDWGAVERIEPSMAVRRPANNPNAPSAPRSVPEHVGSSAGFRAESGAFPPASCVRPMGCDGRSGCHNRRPRPVSADRAMHSIGEGRRTMPAGDHGRRTSRGTADLKPNQVAALRGRPPRGRGPRRRRRPIDAAAPHRGHRDHRRRRRLDRHGGRRRAYWPSRHGHAARRTRRGRHHGPRVAGPVVGAVTGRGRVGDRRRGAPRRPDCRRLAPSDRRPTVADRPRATPGGVGGDHVQRADPRWPRPVLRIHGDRRGGLLRRRVRHGRAPFLEAGTAHRVDRRARVPESPSLLPRPASDMRCTRRAPRPVGRRAKRRARRRRARTQRVRRGGAVVPPVRRPPQLRHRSARPAVDPAGRDRAGSRPAPIGRRRHECDRSRRRVDCCRGTR